jgi:hypothetical protein
VHVVIAGLFGLGLVLGLSACGNSSASSTSISTPTSRAVPTTGATTTTLATPTTGSSVSQYQAFIALNLKLSGRPWTGSQSDAVTRAAFDCSGVLKTVPNGVSLLNYPTDLALIQTYCPEKILLYNQ